MKIINDERESPENELIGILAFIVVAPAMVCGMFIFSKPGDGFSWILAALKAGIAFGFFACGVCLTVTFFACSIRLLRIYVNYRKNQTSQIDTTLN